MGRHKNSEQEEALLKFMEKNPGLAKGFYKGDRTILDKLWKDLATELNSLGPPEKDPTGWRKAWADWKACIRKKLAENRMETTATGGGPYNIQHISAKEDAVAKLCGLYTAVEGVSTAKSFGITRKDPNPSVEVENIDANSIQDELNMLLDELPDENMDPKQKRKRKLEPTQSDIQNFVANQMSTNEKICKVLDDLSNTSKLILKEQKEIWRELNKMRKGFETLTDVIKAKNAEEKLYHSQKLAEYKRNNYVIEQNLAKKQEMKIKELEIELERNKYLEKQ